jgi:YVTN family beta-propeller protein
MCHRFVVAASFLVLAARATAQPPRTTDRPTGTLVVSNMRDNSATVIDASTGRVLATLTTGEGPHEVTVSHDGRWALVSNYGVRERPGNSLTVIDVQRMEVVRTIDLGTYRRPHGMAFFPGDTLIAVTSEASQAVVLVDFRDGHVTGTIATRGRASHMLAMAAKGDRLFTANIADGTITHLEVPSREEGKVIVVGKQPEGITTTPDGNTVWVGSNRDSIVVVVDARRDAASDTLRGFGMPYRLAVSPDSRLVVISDPVKAQVRVFEAASRRERFAIPVPADSLVATAEVAGSPSPEGVAISRDSRWAFVTLQGRNRVATIDLERGTIVAYAVTGSWSDGIGYSPLRSTRPGSHD